MKRYNITTVKAFKNKEGGESKQWNTVGTLVRFDATGEKPEGFALDLNMFPETKFFVFEQKKKEDADSAPQRTAPAPAQEVDAEPTVRYPEDINPSDIPF